MKTAFFGTSDFAVPILEGLAKSLWAPALVVTTPNKKAGRGYKETEPPVKVVAEKLGIPVIQPTTLSPTPEQLQKCDLFLVAAYGKILPRELLAIPAQGSVNVHPSLLPRWRGPSPIQYTILSGDAETGVTIMLMDELVDHGPILGASPLTISSTARTPILTKELAEAGSALLLRILPEWIEGRIVPIPQHEEEMTTTKILKKEDGHIDWSKSALEIERMVRAFKPWPGAYAFWQRGGNQLRLLIVETKNRKQETSNSTDAAGTVVRMGDAIGIQTGNGVLEVTHLQLEGAKELKSEDFLRGHPGIIGSVLS